MTTFRVPQREYEATDGACVTCGSLSREPCRAVKDGVRKAILPRVHRGRPGQRFIIGRRQKPASRRASGRDANRLGARAYDVPPAGPVTMTAADGSVRVQPPAKPQRTAPATGNRQARRRKEQPALAPALDGATQAERRREAAAAPKSKAGKASGSATLGRRALRVDNGTQKWSTTAASPSIHEIIQSQKRGAGKPPQPDA